MHWIEFLIAQYGLAVVFVGTFIEGEAVLSLAGFLAHQGMLSAWAVAAVGACGAFAADQAWFHLARGNRANPRIVKAAASRAGRIALQAIASRRVAFCLGFRFLIGFKTVGPMMAALSGISSLRFACLDAVACAVWAILWTALGFMFGKGIEQIFGKLARFEHRILVGGLVVLAAILAARWITRRFVRARRSGRTPGSGG